MKVKLSPHKRKRQKRDISKIWKQLRKNTIKLSKKRKRMMLS